MGPEPHRPHTGAEGLAVPEGDGNEDGDGECDANHGKTDGDWMNQSELVGTELVDWKHRRVNEGSQN